MYILTVTKLLLEPNQHLATATIARHTFYPAAFDDNNRERFIVCSIRCWVGNNLMKKM
jgi:hypothetical protein